MTKKTFILNVGLARSGTTAASSFMKNHPDIAVPERRKELKYFLQETVSSEDYVSMFTDPAGRHFFEASPPYAQRGVEAFTEVVERAGCLTEAGHRVIILFCIRNLLSRAFSHYWHDIASHYAIYGALWSCRSLDHPERFATLYTKSFAGELTNPQNRAKFLPEVSRMVTAALDRFGEENVRISNMRQLDAALHELCAKVGLPPRPEVRTYRIRSASSPLYLPNGGKYADFVDPDDRGKLQNTCVLFSRWHSEILDGKRYDLKKIRAAARHWTRQIAREDIPEAAVDSALAEADALADLPRGIFLQDTRAALVDEMRHVPDELRIKPLRPNADQVHEILQSVARMP